jgi:hypothetical protein
VPSGGKSRTFCPANIRLARHERLCTMRVTVTGRQRIDASRHPNVEETES